MKKLNNFLEKGRWVRSIQVLASVLFVILTIGCGGSPEHTKKAEPPSPPIDDNLLNLTPDGLNALLWIDMAKFRASPLFGALETVIGDKGVPLIGDNAPIDPVSQADELMLAFATDDRAENGQYLTLIKGSFNSAEVLKSFTKDKDTVSREIDGYPAIVTPKFVIVPITERTLALGSIVVVQKVIELAKRNSKSLDEHPDFSDLSLGGSTIARLRYKPGITAPDFSQYGVAASPVSIDALNGLDGIMTIGKGLEINLTATTETQMDAAGMARELENTRKEIGKNMFAVLLGIDWILERISIKPDKTSVSISISLDESDIEEINRLAVRLSKIRELAESDSKGPLRLPPSLPPVIPEPKR
ncbi:MAG: hypothetical protein GY854_02850 [Deltaproteobacteria bacterium]|nr:hypothetical protein [Deltaproteobacteria bacterium]